MRQTHRIPAVRGQYSPKRTVTIPQIERRVNQSSLNRDAKEPSCDNREEQYGISNEVLPGRRAKVTVLEGKLLLIKDRE